MPRIRRRCLLAAAALVAACGAAALAAARVLPPAPSPVELPDLAPAPVLLHRRRPATARTSAGVAR